MEGRLLRLQAKRMGGELCNKCNKTSQTEPQSHLRRKALLFVLSTPLLSIKTKLQMVT